MPSIVLSLSILSSLLAAGLVEAAPRRHHTTTDTAATAAQPTAAAVATSSLAGAASATTAAASSTASSTTSSSGSTSSGSKKGLAYNNAALLTAWTGKNAGWAYNWAASRSGVPSGLDYYPMAWCPTSTSFESWQTAADQAISQGSTHLLGFNEPDQPSQCNIDYQTAVTGHQKYMNPYKGKAKVGSPAVTNGGGSMGLSYMESFLTACNGQCVVDFMAIHWYSGSANGVANFQSHVTDAITLAKKYNIPEVYVTEFGLTDGSDQDKADFIGKVLPWMDSQSAVGGYAYFMVDNVLNSGSAISSTIGAAYAAA